MVWYILPLYYFCVWYLTLYIDYLVFITLKCKFKRKFFIRDFAVSPVANIMVDPHTLVNEYMTSCHNIKYFCSLDFKVKKTSTKVLLVIADLILIFCSLCLSCQFLFYNFLTNISFCLLKFCINKLN